MKITNMHHVAYRCTDARRTVEFYSKVLGLKFWHAIGSDYVPSTRQNHPHMHIFFEMPDGSNIAFFEVPAAPGGVRDETMPDWIQHFAFETDSMDNLEAAKAELLGHDIEVLGPVRHEDGFIHSIYFFDPDGHRLEITTQDCPPELAARYEAEAQPLLEMWERNHNWSERDGGNG